MNWNGDGILTNLTRYWNLLSILSTRASDISPSLEMICTKYPSRQRKRLLFSEVARKKPGAGYELLCHRRNVFCVFLFRFLFFR